MRTKKIDYSMKEKTPSINLSLQIVPLNTTQSYPIIDEAIAAIQKTGIKHVVQPFATNLEGTFENAWKAVLAAKEAALGAGAEELLLNIQIHMKKGTDVTFEEKTAKFK